jgi:Zn-dependent protease with chaperone function
VSENPALDRTPMKRMALAAVVLGLGVLFVQPGAGRAQTAPASPDQSVPLESQQPASSPAPGVAREGAHERITQYKLTPELHRKAHLFSRIRFGSRLFDLFYGGILLWLILQRLWSARFRDWAEAASRRRSIQLVVYAPLLILTLAVFHLPLDIFDQATFKHYGISVQSWGSWMGDWAKVQGLYLFFGSLFIGIFYWVLRRSPRRWWLIFWLISLPILLFIFFLEPFVIDPMFFRYEPLSAKAPQLVPELQRVVRRAGMEIAPDRMFWMEASTKTIVPNAYVTGVGASKRIVVWDTTIAQETTDGVLTVFGHELGHYALGHVWKGLAFFAGMALLVLYLGFRTIGWLLERRAAAWAIRGLDDWASLPALLLLMGLFGFVANTFGNAFSRHQEHQADIYSLEVTRGIVPDPGQASAASFQRFGEKVFIDPDPSPLNVLLFFDHPTVSDRIHLFVTYDPWSHGKKPKFVK